MTKCYQLRVVVTLALLTLVAGCSPRSGAKVTLSPKTATISKPSTCQSPEPFAEAVSKALSAATLSQSARSEEDWDLVISRWMQAVAGMQAVPLSSPKRAFAQKKVVEYMQNLEGALTKAAGTTRSKLPFSTFNNEFFDRQLLLYLSYVTAIGPPDVLIVGSSRALLGIEPRVLEQALATKGNRNLKVYNFGINGGTAQVVDLLVRQILAPEHLPQLIIWADGVRGFNSGRTDKTYNGIVDSPGYKRLLLGIRPSLLQRKSETSAPFASVEDSSRFAFTANQSIVATSLHSSYPKSGLTASFFRNPHDLVKTLHRNVSTNEKKRGYDRQIQCYLYSSQSQMLQSGFQTVDMRSLLTIEECNRPKLTFVLATANTSISDIDSNGFLPVSVRFNPTNYFQQNPRIYGQYDADYQAFNLGGKQAAALNSLRAFTQSRRISLVLVNLPLTQFYLDSVRRKYEQQFRQFLQQRASQQGFIVFDLSSQWLTQNEYFADPSHLNRYGAATISRQLAADSKITWPRSRY